MTTELEKREKRITLCDAGEMAFLLALGLFVAVIDITKTTMKLELPDNRSLLLILILAFATVFRLLAMAVSERKALWELRRFFMAAIAMDVVYFLIFLQYQKNTLIYLALMTLGSIGIHYRKVLKVYIVAASAVIFPAILMAWTGAIKNLVYIREMTIRSSWGIKYPTDMMSLLLFLLLAVWIVLKDTDDLWFLAPGAALAAMSYFVADSRTGVMCFVVFIIVVLIDRYLSRNNSQVFEKIINALSCIAFPLFTFISIAALYAFKAGLPMTGSLDDKLSGRLTQSLNALNEHGLSLFGKELEQIGRGGTTFERPDYSFVDISYIVILLQFGIIALVMINVIWVLMTRKAIRIGDRRLELALALIAFNALSEHHVAQLNYDILLAIPFTILTLSDKQQGALNEERKPTMDRAAEIKEGIISAAIAAIIAVAGVLVVLKALPPARTVVTLAKVGETFQRRRIYYLACLVAICISVAAVYALYRLCKRSSRRRAYITPIALFAVCLCMFATLSSYMTNKGVSKKAEIIEAERPAIETIISSGGNLYVTDLPSVYKKEFKNIKSSLFNGEELGRYSDVSIIIGKKTDSPVLFGSGCLYTRISDEHALYTNDEEVVKALEEKGYSFIGYYPSHREVNMRNEAKANGLEQEEDGSIRLEGSAQELLKGPRDDLRAGRYTFNYELVTEPATLSDKQQDGQPLCVVKITSRKGKDVQKEYSVYRKDFDENGEASVVLVCELPDSVDTDMVVSPVGDNVVIVRSMSYYKTPMYDTHAFYDKDKVKIAEEYYTLSGDVYTGTWGYFRKELGYDDKGNVIDEKYYDENGNKTLNSAGYHEIKREYNEDGQDVCDEYFGLDGELTALEPGQAAVRYAYDDAGNAYEIAYFDENDKPVMAAGETWGGYHKLVRTFDDLGRVIREDFYDTNNDIVTLKEGFASREYEYDGNGNRIGETYYDELNKPTLNNSGIYELRREFDEEKRLVRESYYGIDGEAIAAESGNASTSFAYDSRGRMSEIDYYGLDGKKVMLSGETLHGYCQVKRMFDEYDRVIHEDFYDLEGNPANANEGYASREPIYENYTTKVLGYRYFDRDGKEIHIDPNN